MAGQMGVPLLSQIPIDPQMVEYGDRGDLGGLKEKTDLEMNKAFEKILDVILKDS